MVWYNASEYPNQLDSGLDKVEKNGKVDKKETTGQVAGQEKQEVIYLCPQCNNYVFKTRDAAVKHRQRYGHKVVGVGQDLNVVDEIGKGRPRPQGIAALAAKKPPISAKGDEHINEHFKGYSKDGESILFIMHPDGKIRDLRLEQPLLYPIYELMVRDRGYQGDFPQFIADAVETLFANAGYELTLAPKSQGIIFEEVTRLLNEGKLELVYRKDHVTLGVTNGDKDERAEGPAPSQGEPGQPQLPKGRKRKKEKHGKAQ